MTTRDIAQAAGIAVGTLFNYFPTKEAIVSELVGEAFSNSELAGAAAVAAPADGYESLEEELFASVAAVLRQLKPLRKHLPALFETTLSPLLHSGRDPEQESIRVLLLEAAHRAAAQHSLAAAMTPLALQLYWSLCTGVLTFWAQDKSPKQEDTLALLDSSMEMYATWLENQSAEGR
jgi:AcrR family transcriptional regulator